MTDTVRESSSGKGEVERLREALMECELALPVLATMCGAAGLNAGKSRAIEILKDVRAALTPPSSPASADRDYHRGIHDAALALDARGHDALAGIVRSLLHKPDYLSPASAEVGEIVERLRKERHVYNGRLTFRSERVNPDGPEAADLIERLSSPSPALAEEALWDDAKYAFGIENADPFDEEHLPPLPSDWALEGAEIIGAAGWVALFRFEARRDQYGNGTAGVPTRVDTNALIAWLAEIGAKPTALATIRAEQGDAR